MLAYSQPMTPAPTTASERGSWSRCSMSSLVKMRLPSNGTCASRVVSVPVAMTIVSAVTVREVLPSIRSSFSVCGVDKRGGGGNQLDMVAQQLMAGDVDAVAR